jgi:DNA polymerase III subunit delta
LKIAAQQIAGVLRDPQRFIGILLYGEDPGLIRERAMLAARAVVGSLDDPFRSSVLMREEHARLLEEARSLSLVGGRRVVRVLDAGDALTAAASRLESGGDGALIILEGGELAARSKLRQMAEKHASWACIACYAEAGASLASDIRRTIEAAGLSVSGDALEFLSRELGSDTATRRSELEKLVVFAAGSEQIDLDMAVTCCTRAADASLDLLLGAVMKGEPSRAGRLLQELVDDGATGPGLIIALSGRVQRLLKVRLEMGAGRSAEEAVRSLLPPVFFRQVASFVREAQLWREADLMQLLADGRSADMACKRGGSRDTTIASQLLLSAARRAARFSRAS